MSTHEEELSGDLTEKTVDNTNAQEEVDIETVSGGSSGTPTPLSEDAAARQLLAGAHKEEVGRTTRSMTQALLTSDEPRNVFKRLKDRVVTLRAALVKRETDKGGKRLAIEELEKLFDVEKSFIDGDLTLLNGMLTVRKSEDRRYDELGRHYEDEKRKVVEMSEAMSKAVEGTNFSDVHELRASFNQLAEEQRTRDERESAILERVGVDSIEKLEERAMETARPYDYGTSMRVLELVNEALDQLKCDDLFEVVNAMITLRKDNTANSALIETIRSEVQAHDSQSIMEAIQQAQLYRDQLLAKIRDLQADFAQVASDRDRYEGDRNQLALENDKLRREALDKETSESTSNSNSHHDDTLQRLRQLRERERQQEQHSAPPSETRILTVPESRGTNGTLMSPGQYGNTVTANENTGRSASPMRINPAHLPALALFDGTKEKWKVFKDGFLLRYEHMGDPAAKQILRELLEGKAKLEYKGLPEEYKTKSVRDCLKWLKDRCFGGLLYETMDFEKKLRNQTVRGRRVDVVCEEMEHWVSKIHTDPSKQEEVKRMQMIFLYEHTKEHRELLKLYEKKEPYSELKTHMRRVEYMDRRESAARFGNVGNRTNSKFAESNSGKSPNSGRVDKRTCYICREVGHGRENCPSFAGGGDARNAGKQCYQCGGMGHMSSTCPSKKVNEGQDGAKVGSRLSPPASAVNTTSANGSTRPYTPHPFTPILQPSRGTGSGGQTSGKYNGAWKGTGTGNGTNGVAQLMVVGCDEVSGEDENQGAFDRLQPVNGNDGGSCKEDDPRSVVDKRDEQNGWDGGNEDEHGAEDPLFFKKFRPVHGTIGGLQVEACLDTGADVNLIDKKTVDRMKDVQVKPEIRFNIRDAQGKPVKSIGTIVVDVKMNLGKECRVGFVVAERELTSILLGNGALEAMGLELRLKEEEVKQVADTRSPDNAIVLRTKYVAPGEMGTILVGGGRPGEGAKVLITDREEIVEGTNDASVIVRVPVWNDSDKDLVFEKHEIIGTWCRVQGLDEKGETIDLAKGDHLRVNQCVQDDSGIRWMEIKENLEKCRDGKLSRRLEDILKSRADMFAVKDEDLGRLHGMECDIRIEEGCRPIRQKERSVPFSLKPALRKLLDKMMAQGVIRRSNSPWLSPVVLVRKKDGSIRICIDFRRVNEVTREDAFPLPHIESILQSLQGKKVFSVMDLSSGFWQLPLNGRSSEITAFATMGDLYEFTVLPFGLNISPAIFQRAMSEVLKEELSKEGRDRVVHCYIDDVLIATETEEEHERVLQHVLDKLRGSGLLLNMKKCKILVDEIEYLGHRLNKNGVHIDERKVQAIKEYKLPETKSQLETFLGMTGYHRRFVESYARIAQPLTRLSVTAGRKLLWTDEAKDAFDTLKSRISSAPVLQQPDYTNAINGSRPFILTTDASGCGIGGVLSQKGDDGYERPLGFFSRGLRESERSMSVVDTEALALYESAMRWKPMLLGARTIVRTDHQPLVTLLKRKHVASRLLRWAAELQVYKFEIEHIKGKSNVVADALSRFPRDELPGENDGKSDNVGVVVNAVSRNKTLENRLEDEKRRQIKGDQEEAENLKKWKIDQDKDDWILGMREKLKEVTEGKRDIEEEVTIPGSTKRTCLADWILHKGVLYLLGLDHERKLYIPEGRRDRFVEEIHNSPLSGHLCTKKLVQKLSQEVFWGSMLKDVQRVLKKCEKCLLANSGKRMIPPLAPLVSNYPMDVVGIDLIEMGRGVDGGKYIVTIIDHFTKFGGAYAVKDKTAESVAKVLLSRWILEGCRTPKTLVSDNGTELVNQIMAEIAKHFEIERQLTLPYHSRANGLTERFNRTIVEIMRRIKMRDDQWEEALPFAMFAYNASPHGSTGETPSFLMYGREEKLPNSGIPQGNPAYTVDLDVDDYKRRMIWMMEKTRSVVVSKLENERRKMKEKYDAKNRHNMHIEPKVGDRVYVRVEPRPGDLRKMVTQFDGPFRVINRSSTTVTVVRADGGLDGGREQDKRVVQWDRVRLVPRDGEGEVENGVVACAVSEEIDCSISRTTIGVDSAVHPDHPCKACGRREVGPFFRREDYKFSEGMRTKTFSTLRELAALLDLREEWGDLSALEAHTEMRKMVDSKNVSSNSLKLAYKKALCDHALLEAEELGDRGVIIEGEEGPVSDAVTEILPCGTGRVSRKNCVVLVPGDSVLQTARGSTQEIELVEYEDEPAMRRQLQAMDHGGSFPRSIVIILKTSFSNEKLKEIRNYIEEIVKKVETTVYIATDILPSKPDELKMASIKSHQEWLTKWRIEKPKTNLVIISQISGLLNHMFPFNTLFMLAQEENKNLFERGIKNIVYGTKFTVEPAKTRQFITPKRSEVPRDGYRQDIKKTQSFPEKKKTYKGDQPNPSDGVCYICGDPTHKSYFHNQPKKIRRQ